MTANVLEPEFDDEQERAGFSFRAARLARQAGAERLGATLYDLPPGEATFPLHYHLGNEEMLIVLRGRPTLRTAEGERELDEGEVVAFPVGEGGVHQVINRSGQPVRLVVVSEMRAPDVVVYPDSGKIGARGVPPGSESDGLRKNFLAADAVDYWEGEEPPGPR